MCQSTWQRQSLPSPIVLSHCLCWACKLATICPSKPTRLPWTLTQPMAANYMRAVQCFRGAKVQLWSLPTAAAHAGDLIPPPCATYHSIQTAWNDPFGARVHFLQPKAGGTKPLSSVITVFAQSDATATIYFIMQFCAVFIRERLQSKSGVH